MTETIAFYHHRVIDLKAGFTFADDGLMFSSLFSKRFINYTEVAGVSRLYYDRQMTFGISQANPNKYRIEHFVSRTGKKMLTRKPWGGFAKKYSGKRLGVGLTSRVKVESAETQRQKDERFESERPPREFTLEAAIAAVLRHCAVELDDQTELDPRALLL